MQRHERNEPLPTEMQGTWVDIDDSSSQLIVSGAELVCFGKPVAYDFKLIDREDGALTVSLKTDDPANEDTFQRANITELVITPEGDFHAYNVKFAIQFVRPEG
jgi:hypothetical protein